MVDRRENLRGRDADREENTGRRGAAAPNAADREEGAGRKSPQSYEELGRLGGEAVKKKYGPEFYAEIGRKGGEAVRAERGPGFYSQIGKKGGEARKAQLMGRRKDEGADQP